MSDDVIHWVPVDPTFVPGVCDVESALAWLQTRAPQAHDIRAERFSEIHFIYCGANLEAVRCPRCAVTLSFTWWGDSMSRSAATHFIDRTIQVPCCGGDERLDSLVYDWPCGFAIFALSIRNIGIEPPTEDDDLEIATRLRTPVRRILQHV